MAFRWQCLRKGRDRRDCSGQEDVCWMQGCRYVFKAGWDSFCGHRGCAVKYDFLNKKCVVVCVCGGAANRLAVKSGWDIYV